VTRGKTMSKQHEDFLIDTWADWKEGDIHIELCVPKDNMNCRVTSLRKKLKRHNDDRWKLLYRKVAEFTEDQQWIIDHYHEGIDKTAAHFGITRDALRMRVRAIRDHIRNNGLEKLRGIYPGREPERAVIPVEEESDELPNYGVVHQSNRCKDKDATQDPRPDWLVINYTVGV